MTFASTTRWIAFAGAMGAATLVAQSASAETIAYNAGANTAGNQAWAGALGGDFNVGAAPIYVYSLGVFDDNSDGLKVPLVAYIYNRDTQALVVKLNFAAGSGELIGGHRFLPLPCPVELPAGFHGVMVADGFGATERNGNQPQSGNTDNGGGAISFVGTGRYAGAAGVFPTTIDGGPANRYRAGTFAFAVACADDTGCTNTEHPKCTSGICGHATSNFYSSCSGATPACNLTNGTCSACQNVAGPANACLDTGMRACKGTGECVQCTDSAACSGTTPVCGAANACLACDGDNAQPTTSPCPTSGAPFCKANGSCGACDGDFGSGAGNACTSSMRPFCKTDGSCGTCANGFGSGLTDACGTASKPACVAGACTAANGDNGTTATAPCPTSANPFANNDGTCGKCTQNTDCNGAQHAGAICNTGTGACGNVCTGDGDCTSASFCDLSAMPSTCAPKKSGGGACTAASQCLSNSCTATKCDTGCTVDANCATTDYCDTGAMPKICKAKKANGAACTAASECTGGACTANMCASIVGDAGTSDSGTSPSDAGDIDATAPLTDSGSGTIGGADASTGGGGGNGSTDSGTNSNGAASSDEGGCSCESPRANVSTSPYVLSLFGVAAGFGIWRRRKSR